MDWSSAITDSLQQRVVSSTLRQRRSVRILDATHVRLEKTDSRLYPDSSPGHETLINFASNNYLGLTHHPRVIESFTAVAREHGVGSGAAALVTGHTTEHENAECALAKWKGTESAVLATSGFAANQAAVQALATVAARTPGKPGARFLVDKLAHASLIDAVRNTGSFRVFPHNNIEKLRRLLAAADPDQMQVVVTESIFSMDGDAADLPGIVALKREFPFFVVLDEAHASGVYGPNGAGYACELGLQDQIDLTVVTLSKALGCSGGAVCGSRSTIDAVVNFGRPYIFSTSIPPAVAAAAATAIDVLCTEPARQQRLRSMSADIRNRLQTTGLLLPPGDSPILPIILGGEAETLAAAARLQSLGILTVAVRPPTVPRGSSRLRITLSSEHTPAEIDQLVNALADASMSRHIQVGQ